MTQRLPDFLGLGTQKGGTTTLHTLLAADPRFVLPACKEVHYFDLRHHESIDWYAAHFAHAKDDEMCGEISPYYLFHPDVPSRIHALLPTVKLIVLLRDPVERALSQVFHAKRRGFESLDVADALDAEQARLATGDPYSLQKHSYVSRSRYIEQLDRYLALFPKKQLLVLRSEDLFDQPNVVWEQLLDFLGLAVTQLPSALPRANAGVGEASTINPAIRARLREELEPTARAVKQRYGFGWSWMD